MTSEVQKPGKFAYGLLDLSKDQDFRFSENPKVVQQADKTYHKKPGRKPLTNIPDSKRKAQILTAQRAFRERKKYYVEDLEKKVKTCESSHSNAISLLQKELLELKEYLAKLETENKALKRMDRSSNPSYGSPRNPQLEPTYSYSVGSMVNSEAPFRGIPASFEFPQLSDLNGPPISSAEAVMPISEVSFSPCENAPVQNFPASKPFDLINCLSDAPSPLGLLSSSLDSELLPMPNSYPPSLANAFSPYPKAAVDESPKYYQPLYCPDPPMDIQSNLQSIGTGSCCKTPSSFDTKSRDEAALCESLTCVAIGLPATSVSTERLVLELEENGTPPSETSDHGFLTKPSSRRKYLSARDVWEKFATNPEFAHLSIDCLCKQLKSKVKVISGCSGEKMHVVIAEDEVSAAFERLHVGTSQ
ncbi:hypothetical protein K493DRAFT_410359 [Basidiobolus meristosporus CBS 931.73]|uniref:BZIP domain-containing protein n=1 Tax=Basidiobolus meristosporus CBS 931.73 TaxID=1314790 RepID=A0A1Y1XUX2_9FUNG|nr:hypothetical protein K493DRAFT_410359 [Basidiobolus meristosporus CBS 931.73]|eukprot:ORX89567.1 hypothetical protein K493DRAFT_410359 [Basidiobolus meristosporus CBS 931.73]